MLLDRRRTTGDARRGRSEEAPGRTAPGVLRSLASSLVARRPSLLVFHPRYERFLRRVGVTSAEAALDLRGEIVCGHPDRHVARVELGEGPSRRVVYLKREHVVGLRTRLRSRLAGYGWASRSEREAATLRRLEAAGLPGPQWLAYGEDGAGRAFLIVDELGGMDDLRAVLGDTGLSSPDRRRLAELVGRAVAELHEAGFGTPELAAKHLFVNPATGDVSLVDWQSAPRAGMESMAARFRQLAGLHASLADELASPRERLRFLRAYLRTAHQSLCPPGRAKPKFGPFARVVASLSGPLRGRSSARDQRLPPAPRLVWLAGEQVCVVPEMAEHWPSTAVSPPFYLDAPADRPPVSEEWVTFPDGRRALLTRFTTVDPLGRLTAAVRERPWRSPAATAARVLFHLRRHGVPAPNLLAFGQRLRFLGRADSFLLCEPVAAAVPVAVRLAQLPGDCHARWNMLHRCGETLRRLHDAGCRTVPAREPVLVASAAGLVAVACPSAVRLTKRVTARDRAADLRRFLRAELPGLDRADRARVVRGYLGDDWSDRAARRALLTGIA
jgi:tRNA A-37 threonylcarbamoyl transferase component Bud32